MKRFVFCIIILSVILAVIFFLKTSLNNPIKYFTFYYAKHNSTGIEGELREVEKNKKEKIEKLLVQEYLLGPMNYNLRFDISQNLKIQDLFLVYSSKSIDAVINFNSTFLDEVEKIDEWTLKAFLETIKVNTKIKRVLLLSDGKRIREKVGKYNLSQFIELKNI